VLKKIEIKIYFTSRRTLPTKQGVYNDLFTEQFNKKLTQKNAYYIYAY